MSPSAMTLTWRMLLRMSEVFADTSALYALLVDTDANHEASLAAASSLRGEGARLVTTSFVVLETVSLLQSRIGVEAVRTFYRDVLPLLEVVLGGRRTAARRDGRSSGGVAPQNQSHRLVGHHAHARTRNPASLCVRRRLCQARSRPRSCEHSAARVDGAPRPRFPECVQQWRDPWKCQTCLMGGHHGPDSKKRADRRQ